MKDLDPFIKEAVSTIHIINGLGHPYSLLLGRRVKLLLITQLIGKFNRMFAYMLTLFSMLLGIDVSYKTEKRLYSDYEVVVVIHNLLCSC